MQVAEHRANLLETLADVDDEFAEALRNVRVEKWGSLGPAALNPKTLKPNPDPELLKGVL